MTSHRRVQIDDPFEHFDAPTTSSSNTRRNSSEAQRSWSSAFFSDGATRLESAVVIPSGFHHRLSDSDSRQHLSKTLPPPIHHVTGGDHDDTSTKSSAQMSSSSHIRRDRVIPTSPPSSVSRNYQRRVRHAAPTGASLLGNTASSNPIQLIPDLSHGMIDPFSTSCEASAMFMSTSATDNRDQSGNGLQRAGSWIAPDDEQTSSSTAGYYYSPLFGGSRDPQQHYHPSSINNNRNNYDSNNNNTNKNASSPSTATPSSINYYYDADKRKSAIQQSVDAAKRRQMNEYTARALNPTSCSKAKSCSKNVGLAEARRLHDPDSVHMRLAIGPKQCQVKHALKWMSKLSGDPEKDKKVAARRAAEIANAQIARRRMSDCESERRLLNLTHAMKNEMATFLNHLLDWASSGSAIAGRRNETEKQLAETVANRENSAMLFPGGAAPSSSSSSSSSSALTSNAIVVIDPITGEQQQLAAHQTSWSFLRASSKAAGNAVLTVDAFAVLKGFFDILDVDGSGSLTLDEIEAAAKLIGREESSLVAAMKTVDRDQSGAIDFVEIVKVFFPTLSLAQIARFEKAHRDEIGKRMDPRVRMDAEDIKDIEDVYLRFSKMPGGGCTFENMLSQMDGFMRDRPEILGDAFYLYDKDHDGALTASEFFDFMKFSYPPYAYRARSAKDEADIAQRRSLIPSSVEQHDEAVRREKQQRQQEVLRGKLLLVQQQQQQHDNGNTNTSSDHHLHLVTDFDDAPIVVHHDAPKYMIVPNAPKTGLGTNPNSIASAWHTGNLASITMDRQKERLKKEADELRKIRRRQRHACSSVSSSTGLATTPSGGSPGGRARHSSRTVQQACRIGRGAGDVSSRRSFSSATRTSSVSSKKSMSTDDDDDDEGDDEVDGDVEVRVSSNRQVSTNNINGDESNSTRRRKVRGARAGNDSRNSWGAGGGGGGGGNDGTDDDEYRPQGFSLDALAEARWNVVREGLNRDPAALTATIVMGTRDLPPVDSVKHRLIQEHYRRYGTLPEIASMRNLLLIARGDDTEALKQLQQQQQQQRQRDVFTEGASGGGGGGGGGGVGLTTGPSVAARKRPTSCSGVLASTSLSAGNSNNRHRCGIEASGFDVIAKATANYLAMSRKNRIGTSKCNGVPAPASPAGAASATVKSIAKQHDESSSGTSKKNSLTLSPLLCFSTATSLASVSSPFTSSSARERPPPFTTTTTTSTTTTTTAPSQLSSRVVSGDDGVAVDAETAKAAASMFVPRVPTSKRLERTLGGEYFTARGDFSPERAQRSEQSVFWLEKIKSRLIVPPVSK